MEPVYRAANDAGVGPEGAASAAVLAGHFMIWSGPATTMCQRKFVPDWFTCAIIQPLGLMEDVAVVLAAWAGESAASEKQAEIGLYIFMAAMNLVNWAAHRKHNEVVESSEAEAAQLAKGEKRKNWTIHGIVFVITMIALAVCVATPVPDVTT